MKKIGFTGKCPNGDISVLSDQIKKLREVGVDSLEVSIYETDVICGQKINQHELKILKNTLLSQDIDYTVHGELSVNLMDQENFQHVRLPSKHLGALILQHPSQQYCFLR